MNIADLTLGDKESFEKDPETYTKSVWDYSQRLKSQLEDNLAALLEDHEHYKMMIEKADGFAGYMQLVEEIATFPFILITWPISSLKARRYSKQRDAYSVLAFKAQRLGEFFSSVKPTTSTAQCISLTKDIYSLCVSLADKSVNMCLLAEDSVRGRYPHFFRKSS